MNDLHSSIQLWPFLIDLLSSREYIHLIRWVDDQGQFEFIDPEQVSQLWGQQKGIAYLEHIKLILKKVLNKTALYF